MTKASVLLRDSPKIKSQFLVLLFPLAKQEGKANREVISGQLLSPLCKGLWYLIKTLTDFQLHLLA